MTTEYVLDDDDDQQVKSIFDGFVRSLISRLANPEERGVHASTPQ